MKKMWLIIFAVTILLGIACALYLTGKVANAGIFDRIETRSLRKLAAFVVVALAVAVLIAVFDVTNAIIIIIHVAVFLLLGDLVGFVLRHYSGSGLSPLIFDAAALICCVAYLCVGWYLMHGLWETDYFLATPKDIGTLRIAHIADSHIGCGFSGKGFAEKLAVIEAADPDILMITGDFVDDDTSKQDMLDACAALGDLNIKYGIYFCFGNHDRGYSDGSSRGYTGDDLTEALTQNGITVLEDESVLIDGRFYVIGRADAGYGNSAREDIASLISDLDRDRYMIVLDHQPTDYEAEEAAGVDLVLSGHTHGGQIFPLEYIQPIVSENDAVSGLTRRGDTDFIVTDGISDWAIKFKTGCKSEYNIITVNTQDQT